MALKPYSESYISSIANVLRTKVGTTSTFTIKEMAPAINQYNNYYLKDYLEGNLYTLNLPELTRASINAAFRGCENLSYVNLPNVSMNLGDNYFAYCYNLKEIQIPNVVSIGSSAFYNCYNLSSITVPKVGSIGSSAFYNCSNLSRFEPFESLATSSITISLYSSAFAYTGLTKLNLSSTITLSLKGYGIFAYCSQLSSVSTSTYASTIPSSTFMLCSNLNYVSIPNTTGVYNYAFESCYRLTTVNVQSRDLIGHAAFLDCRILSSINLPSVSVLQTQRFSNCFSLRFISLPICEKINT